jgi:hypothetical protein
MNNEIDPEADEIAYSFPILTRICVGGMGLLFLAGDFYQTWLLLNGEFASGMGWRGVIGLILGFMLSGLLLWMASPRDLIINMLKPSYRLRQGLPLIARWQTGDVNDMAGLYVRRRVSKGGDTYFLMVSWRVPGRRATLLGEYKDSETALRHCRRLGERLASPVRRLFVRSRAHF